MAEGKDRLFLFQKNDMVVPSGVSDSALAEGISGEEAAAFFPGAEFFSVPAVDAPLVIRGAFIPPSDPLPPGFKGVPVRGALSVLTGEREADGRGSLGRMLRAFHIAQWRAESRFCGSCGGRNTDAEGELARLCPRCGRLEFPRISPAVITLIINGEDRALLAHNRKFSSGVYSLIAGFNEAGESLEATVAREIREEVGLEVGDIRYIVSQPWPFPNSLMLGFSARYVSGEVRPDGAEIEDARWLGRDDLPLLPGYGSVSRSLIEGWIAGRIR
ncbi:MAG: NAD(+) diphosphatase [Treponema sp.]|jgi:NAD+ diphosphatase|nr:NAD(+) diphosphatase [Treponema sp.]